MNNFDMVDDMANHAQVHCRRNFAAPPKPEFVGPTRALRGWELDARIAEKMEPVGSQS